MAGLVLPAAAADVPDILPDPDGKPGLSNRPLKVFILSGQSNMCGMGKPDSLKPLATGNEKFGYLIDDSGKWTVRKDVFYLYSLMGKKLAAKGWLSATVNGGRLGPEVGIGHVLGQYHDEMVLLIKACCGNRSLGFDVMPPTSRKRTGNTDNSKKYYHGWSYDNWVKAVHDFLGNLKGSFPAYQGQGYEVAGFFWWQGHKDKGMAKEKYEQLLAELIGDFRAEFKAPKAPFVVATIGFSGRRTGAWTGVFEAQMAVSDPARHPEFAGNVASVDIRDMGGGGYHYGNNGATYAKVGDAMGRAMAKLLEHAAAKRAEKKAKKKAAAPKLPSRPAVDRSAVEADKLYRTAREAERMGQRGLARTFYKRVVDKYPDTPAARKAAERLKGQ
ncbi:MAG: sialate O-acetylesterase [Planctomycetota bacterium]|jgi:alpha-galactosidase